VEEVAYVHSYEYTLVSLQSTVSREEDDRSLEHFLPNHTPLPEEETLRNLENARLHSLLEQVLDDREKYIVQRRFGLGGVEPAILDELGSEYGRTRETIRKWEKQALNKLHEAITEQNG
jgi:RNA polymerase nonessential primary-like sigma factor